MQRQKDVDDKLWELHQASSMSGFVMYLAMTDRFSLMRAWCNSTSTEARVALKLWYREAATVYPYDDIPLSTVVLQARRLGLHDE